MRILLEYNKFLKSTRFSSIFESSTKANVGIVGDSHVGLYTKVVPQLITFDDGGVKLNVGGWSSTKLLEGCQKYKQTHPEISVLFIKIGDNDGYRVNLVEKNAPLLKKELTRIFPNAQRFVVIKGSWGWGGLSRFQSETEPPEFVSYYDVFRKNGFELTTGSQGKRSDAQSHIIHDGIKSQSEEIKKIIGGAKPTGELATDQNQSTTQTGVVGGYYKGLSEAIEKGTEIKKQEKGTMAYNQVVEAAQIGLKFLGFDLPKYGADGYFGPETENSVKGFKQANKIEGDPNTMDKNFFTALKSKLEEGKFDDTKVKQINTQFAEDFGKTLSENDGNTMWIYWLAHNQGAYGASELLRVALDPNPAVKFAGNLRSKFMSDWAGKSNHIRRNVGDRGQDGVFKSQIKAAYDDGNDKGVAIAFSSYQKWKFHQMYQKGNESIHTKPEIKEIFQQALKEKGSSIPFEFLAAVAYQESGFNPQSGNNVYKGLFALKPGESTGLTDETVKDPYKNTMAAIDFWNRNIPSLQSKLTAEVKNSLKVQPLA